jgi:hypothetical protein
VGYQALLCGAGRCCGLEWAVGVNDCTTRERFGVEEFESASAFGAKPGFSGSVDAERVQIRYSSSRPAAARASGELSGAPDEQVVIVSTRRARHHIGQCAIFGWSVFVEMQ